MDLYWLASSRELLKLSLLQEDLQRLRSDMESVAPRVMARAMVDSHDPDIEKLWYGVDRLCKVQRRWERVVNWKSGSFGNERESSNFLTWLAWRASYHLKNAQTAKAAQSSFLHWPRPRWCGGARRCQRCEIQRSRTLVKYDAGMPVRFSSTLQFGWV
jgi:hypothetical protein